MFYSESLCSYQYLIRVFNAKQKELMSFRVLLTKLLSTTKVFPAALVLVSTMDSIKAMIWQAIAGVKSFF